MGTYKYSRIAPTALVPRDLLLGEIPQNIKRSIKQSFFTVHRKNPKILFYGTDYYPRDKIIYI